MKNNLKNNLKNNSKSHIIIFSVIIAIVLLISSMNPSFLARAYWWEISPSGLSRNLNAAATIGSWDFKDVVTPPDGVIVVIDNETEALPVQKVVYYNGELIYITNHGVTRDFVGQTQPNWNTLYFGWTWKPYLMYQQNQAVIHNGRIYIGASSSGSLVGSAHDPDKAQFWDLVGSIEWLPGKIYRTTGTIVEYNGNLYRTKWHTSADVPPDQHGAFELLTNTTYVSNQSYTTGRVVRYNGGVYIALKDTTYSPIAPVKGHWKRLDSPAYSMYHQYVLYDVVLYNGHYYQVANASLANSNAPTTVSYAWNQIDTYTYNPQNVYKLNHLVIYNNAVYRSLLENNTQPITNQSAWTYYGSSPNPAG